MILNNYRAISSIRGRAEALLTPAMVVDLHRVLTEGTLDDPAAAGRVQRPGERRVNVEDTEGNVLHVPPPAEELPDRLDQMCAFANADPAVEPEGFLHPVVRAILLHFWLAYDHPFVDGNGRTARALFYWSMLRSGYWLAEFLSISSILRAAPARYGKSFLYTETDENDATYFILSQLEVVGRAIEELQAYLERQMEQVHQVEQLLGSSTHLNRRQLDLFRHALRHPDAEYTFQAHARSQGVVYQSARTDLIDLQERGFLRRYRQGQQFRFRPVADLGAALSA